MFREFDFSTPLLNLINLGDVKQCEIARAAQVSDATVSRWINMGGLFYPSVPELWNLRDGFTRFPFFANACAGVGAFNRRLSVAEREELDADGDGKITKVDLAIHERAYLLSVARREARTDAARDRARGTGVLILGDDFSKLVDPFGEERQCLDRAHRVRELIKNHSTDARQQS